MSDPFMTTRASYDPRGTIAPEPRRPSAGDGYRWELRAACSHETVPGSWHVLWFWELVKQPEGLGT